MSQYDQFAEVYEAWTEASTAAHSSAPFYIQEYSKGEKFVVELGVGTGRIALEAARQGIRVVGVDLSGEMLARCRAKVQEEGLGDRVHLIQADFREFSLPEPAPLIALPYHSVGHLTEVEHKSRALAQVYSQLQSGGRFIFDDFFYRPELEEHLRRVELKGELKHPSTGNDTLMWVTSILAPERQIMRMVTWTDELDEDGVLLRRQYRRLWLSWLTPAQWEEELVTAGFTIEACYGDFDRTPFDAATAREQVWVVRKP